MEYTKADIVEARMEGISKDVERIMTNHLPHIQAAIDETRKKVDENHEQTGEKLDKISTRIAWVGGGISVIVFLINIIPIIKSLLSNL